MRNDIGKYLSHLALVNNYLYSNRFFIRKFRNNKDNVMKFATDLTFFMQNIRVSWEMIEVATIYVRKSIDLTALYFGTYRITAL